MTAHGEETTLAEVVATGKQFGRPPGGVEGLHADLTGDDVLALDEERDQPSGGVGHLKTSL